jgi:hypothetical protein
LAQGVQLLLGAHHKDVLATYLFYNSGADLLIPSAKNVTLAADEGNDDFGLSSFQ